MIILTRLNDKTFMLNAFLIEQIEAHPDTTISLISGKKIVVKESVDVVQERILELYQKIGIVNVFHHDKGDDACLKAKF
jgi:flagellar protein FlbD